MTVVAGLTVGALVCGPAAGDELIVPDGVDRAGSIDALYRFRPIH